MQLAGKQMKCKLQSLQLQWRLKLKHRMCLNSHSHPFMSRWLVHAAEQCILCLRSHGKAGLNQSMSRCATKISRPPAADNMYGDQHQCRPVACPWHDLHTSGD